MQKLIECVPNFSEGQNPKIIEKIAQSIRNISGVKLLDIDAGFHANRTVMTFVGEPNAMQEAIFQAIKTASETIDMSLHKGTHPRIGATDVCPLVPIAGIEMDEVIEISKNIGKRVWDELKIPAYLYNESAQIIERKNLAWIRNGEYENLEQKLKNQDFKPDYGDAIFNPKSGICIIGARKFLLAYNINLATKDVKIAKEISKHIRESSPNGLKNVKAIGWYIEEFDKVQVSMNLTDFLITDIFTVFQKVSILAHQFNTQVTGSELVGMIPLAAIIQKNEPNTIENVVKNANLLGLNDVKPFEPSQKVIELALHS